MTSPQDFIMMPIPASAYTAVCALLGGAIVLANQTGPTPGNQRVVLPTDNAVALQDTAQNSAPSANTENSEQVGSGPTATNVASPSDGDVEIDAHGHPWNEAMHASTRGKTKDGLWRMKVGVSRPDPLPGFPKDSDGASAGTGTSPATLTPSATSQTVTEPANVPAVTSGDDEDEFAAFRAAADASNAADAAAAASVPARQFSDADLGALCNQAAVKLGDPSPIKEIIARFVPEGQVAHSRNIPTERREEFAKEVEGKAGIQFAG